MATDTISVLVNAITTLMDSNKALTERVEKLESKTEAESTATGKATEAEIDDVMKGVRI